MKKPLKLAEALFFCSSKKILKVRIKFLLLFLFCVIHASAIQAQEIAVTGQLTEQDGSPLIGATVSVQGTTIGVITDVNGNYSIEVEDANVILVFSYVGYASQEIPVNNQTTINVVLEVEAIGIQEVVMIGYTSRLREELTGAVSTVNMDVVESESTGQLAKALQGSVAGVTVINEGNPGAGTNIRIRGIGTINNSDPLWIVDGVSVAEPPPAHEVESVHVLKDAVSTAIYGARGANGVIVVKTKSGKKNRPPQVTFNIRRGVSSSNKKLDILMTPQEYGELTWLKYANAGLGTPNDPLFGSGATPDVPDYLLPARGVTGSPEVDPALYDIEFPGIYQIIKTDPNGTDWYDVISQVGTVQEYSLNVGGGTDRSTYSLSAGYLDEDGIIKYTNYKRYTVNFQQTLDITDWLTLGGKASLAKTRNRGSMSNNARGSAFDLTFKANPIMPVYDIMGNWAGNTIPTLGIGNGNNPLAQLWRARNNGGDGTNHNENLFIELKPIDGLVIKSQFAYAESNHKGESFGYPEPEYFRQNDYNTLNKNFSNTRTYEWSNTANYRKVLENHTIEILAGTEMIESNYENLTGYREGFYESGIDYQIMDAGTQNQQNGGTKWSWAVQSYFGRLHYEFANRYLFDATFRRDGSSRFGALSRWGDFPAFSAGWRLSEEGFMDGTSSWLSDLKLRASWGKSGNDQIGNYNGFTTFGANLNNSYYPIDGSDNSVTPGYQSTAFGNKEAKWETTTAYNIGIDAALFYSLRINVDLWQRNTDDMLLQKGIPGVAGAASVPYVNIGQMTNKGMDIEVEYGGRALGGELRYSISTYFTHYRNELVKMTGVEGEYVDAGDDLFPAMLRAEEGTSFPEFFGYEVDGIFQTQAEADGWAPAHGGGYNAPGHWRYIDQNGDGVVDPDDRIYLGNPHPDFTAGLNLAVNYKGFDLSANFYGSYGNDLLAHWRGFLESNVWVGARSPTTLYESWGSPYLSDNADATLPMSEIDDTWIKNATSHFIEDGSYLRLRTLQLGYTLPASMTERLKIKNLEIYVIATNLFTLTKYSGLDPEQGGVSGIRLGQDMGTWPIPKTAQVGIHLGF